MRFHAEAVRTLVNLGARNHWIVHVECLYGRGPGELFGLAKNLGDRVARALMRVRATSWKLTIQWPSCLADTLRFPRLSGRWIIARARRADRLDWRKLGMPRNWKKLGVKIGSVRVVKTSKSIIIHPGRLRGFDVDELLMISGRIVERVKMVLENHFDMLLEEPSVPLHQPITRFYSEEAKELVRKFGTTVVEDVGSIDNSPPERVPHEEYKGRDLSKARLFMPLRLLRLESKVDGLGGEVHELVSVLKTALAPKEGKVDSSQPLKDESRRYIT